MSSYQAIKRTIQTFIIVYSDSPMWPLNGVPFISSGVQPSKNSKCFPSALRRRIGFPPASSHWLQLLRFFAVNVHPTDATCVQNLFPNIDLSIMPTYKNGTIVTIDDLGLTNFNRTKEFSVRPLRQNGNESQHVPAAPLMHTWRGHGSLVLRRHPTGHDLLEICPYGNFMGKNVKKT